MNSNYTEWKKKVNRLVEAKYFLGCDDLPDMPYRDWFDDEYTPREALEAIDEELQYEGWAM